MVSHVQTVTFEGISAVPIETQVHLSSGLMAFTIVGLPDKTVAESKERIRSALQAIGLSLPPKRITVNLSPANKQKEGSHFDLPIALGLLSSMEIISQEELDHYVVLGELSLDGRIRSVPGVLPAALLASSKGLGLICPSDSGNEGALGGPLEVLAPHNLLALLNHFKGAQILSPPEPLLEDLAETKYPDLSTVRGQPLAKRALEIAAAGSHNMIMVGPPGSGKSMLAQRLPGLLPPLEPQEALEVTMIYSLAGLLQQGKLLRKRPFRDPAQGLSLPALLGGGVKAHPGEISLAHNGVLFLDEIPEFSRSVLEALRQPLETWRITIARANAHITYPARFQLVAAMNPCRCGYLDDPARACNKAPKCAREYQMKLSGPFLDRIDLHVEVPALSMEAFSSSSPEESSDTVRERLLKVRIFQKDRFKKIIALSKQFSPNALIEDSLFSKMAPLSWEGRSFLQKAVEHFNFSARSYSRIIRLARTVADLSYSDTISINHLKEALVFRKISY